MTATRVDRRLPLVVTVFEQSRRGTDRLELLQTLIAAPAFDPLFRGDVLRLPGDHPVFGWQCKVEGCDRGHEGAWELCHHHRVQWSEARRGGRTFTAFLAAAQPLKARGWPDGRPCRICPHLPAVGAMGVCIAHAKRWIGFRRDHEARGGTPVFETWLARQTPLAGTGKCRVTACGDMANPHPMRMCTRHQSLYEREGRPGDARTPDLRRWRNSPAVEAPLTCGDEAAFLRWCDQAPAVFQQNGVISLLGMAPLLKAEVQWALADHAKGQGDRANWPSLFVHRLVQHCRSVGARSLSDLDLEAVPISVRGIAKGMLACLRLVYFTRQDTKDAGFIETDHYGVRFTDSGSHYGLLGISQRWLRDLLWDYFDARLRNQPPRSQGPFKTARRGCVELSAYLEAQTPGGGRDPRVLAEEHMISFVADQRHRGLNGLPALGHDPDAVRVLKPNASPESVARILGGTRQVLRFGLDEGLTFAAGLDHRFVIALPHAGVQRGRRRRPFTDDIASALADPDNLARLDRMDTDDRGLRDIWETQVVTGRRSREVVHLRLDCVARINRLPLLWHDQTKVGNLDEGIRIPERLVQRIEARQAKTVDRFVERHGRPPTAEERAVLALFPRKATNRSGRMSMTTSWFQNCFADWVGELDIKGVPHQARHTLATNLIKAGANLVHVKRYLGHVSEAMAEHYVHLASTDPRLTDALNAVWVAGPGTAEPGRLLSAGQPMSRKQAEALAIDLARTSTPADGGFCTFQPVVNGDACPWNLDCHNCDKFVLSGADLLYWRRKREQWRTLAERAPDPATADFLHDAFEPTARAIDGLEKALTGVGLLEEALALDLRRPQDYFGRIWTTAFRARELAGHESAGGTS
ncbi:tyrosine-type recombinase/integrase [Kitasatospora purpeofusca]|uniref:tyrosine-type recombinase/integrase n=1 Tax=Kitasatospora purpeofusca TaxID=67352 RepID=UPI003F4A9EEC